MVGNWFRISESEVASKVVNPFGNQRPIISVENAKDHRKHQDDSNRTPVPR